MNQQKASHSVPYQLSPSNLGEIVAWSLKRKKGENKRFISFPPFLISTDEAELKHHKLYFTTIMHPQQIKRLTEVRYSISCIARNMIMTSFLSKTSIIQEKQKDERGKGHSSPIYKDQQRNKRALIRINSQHIGALITDLWFLYLFLHIRILASR